MRKEPVRIVSLPNVPEIGRKSVYLTESMHIGRTAELVQVMHLPDGSLQIKDAAGDVFLLPSAYERKLKKAAGAA